MLQINKYLQHLEFKGKAINTIETYHYHLLAFDAWLSYVGKVVDEVSRADILEFKEALPAQKKSGRTVNGILSCVRNYYDYLMMAEEVRYNPVSKMIKIKVTPHLQRRLTDEEINEFISYIDQLPHYTRAAFYLMLGTGARVAEVAKLRKSDFQYIDGALYINIHDAKWGSDRQIPAMFPQAAKIVAQYINKLDVSSESAFRCSARTLQRHASNFAKKMGINFSCHVLRHTFATRLLENGVPIEQIQLFLGHRSLNMTRHYTQNVFSSFSGIAPQVF